MERETVDAFRERSRIDEFLAASVAQGRMTEFERQIVRQEGEEVSRRAGYLDARSGIAAEEGQECAAVERQSNHLMRRKIVELHPDLKAELDRFIARRRYHPLPPVPPDLAKPGVSLVQYRALIGFIAEKRKQGVIGNEEAHEMYAPAIEVFDDSGVDYAQLSERTDKAVLAQAHHLMKKRLIDLHPELADEIRNLACGQRR